MMSVSSPVQYDLDSPAYDMVAADFNNDSAPDLAAVGSGGVSVLLGNGDGSFQPAQIIGVASSNANQLVAGDFDNDENLDLLVGFQSPDQLRILFGNGDGSFRVGDSFALPDGQVVGPAVVADFNGDGDADLAVDGATFDYSGPKCRLFCNGGSLRIQHHVNVLVGKGDGTFTPTQTTAVKAGTLAAGDFNSDGRVDVLTGGVQLLEGIGDGTLGRPSTVVRKAGTLLAVEDFNGDGHLDFIESKGGVFLGNGAGAFAPAGTLPVDATRVTAGDLNNDGVIDLVTTEYSTRAVNVLLGNGNGTFVEYETLPVSYPPVGVGSLLADLNNDGRLDLVLSESDGLSVLLNDGSW